MTILLKFKQFIALQIFRRQCSPPFSGLYTQEMIIGSIPSGDILQNNISAFMSKFNDKLFGFKSSFMKIITPPLASFTNVPFG